MGTLRYLLQGPRDTYYRDPETLIIRTLRHLVQVLLSIPNILFAFATTVLTCRSHVIFVVVIMPRSFSWCQLIIGTHRHLLYGHRDTYIIGTTQGKHLKQNRNDPTIWVSQFFLIDLLGSVNSFCRALGTVRKMCSVETSN